MESRMELQYILYNLLKTQIRFGVYRAGERLPTIENASLLLGVSTRTIRGAYQQLQDEALITISKSIGVKTNVNYSEAEIEQHIQDFFSCHKDALIDLGLSLQPLLSRAQLLGFKNVRPEQLDHIEQLAKREDILPSYKLIKHLQLIYGSLNNDLFMRLIWQILTFFLAPFLSVSDNLKGLEPVNSPLLNMVQLCRQNKWPQLQTAIEDFQKQMASALCRFYDNRITAPVSIQQEPFQWSCYKMASQRCYSLAMEYLIDIIWGRRPDGTMLPSIKKIAAAKQVSVITARRTISLLNSIGVTKTLNGIGTEIRPINEITVNCDFTQPTVRNRLLDFVKSLQLLALSCRQVSEITFASNNTTAIEQCRELLNKLKQWQRCELTAYGIIELITHLVPLQTIKNVYSSLFQQLFWGCPVRNMKGSQKYMNSLFSPHLDYLMDCLERKDITGFSVRMEELLISELDFTIEQLFELGIQNVSVFSIHADKEY